MPIGCDDVDARMLELLYGELPEGERAALQAHLDGDGGGCDRCRRELAELRGVRTQARQVLDEAPPARAHAAILRVAEAAAAARARVVPAVVPAARGSWWERHRSRWTFPTLATIGAVAVFLLANKIFLEPERTYERGRQGLVPAASPAPAAEAPGTDEPAPSAAPEAAQPAKPSATPAGGGPPPRGGRVASGSIKGAGTGADDLPARAALPAHRRMNPPRSQDQTAKREPAEKEESAAMHPVTRAEQAAKADVDDNPLALDRAFAPPPPPRMAQPAAAAPPRAPAKKSVSDSVELEGLMGDRGSGGGLPGSPAATGAGPAATGARAKAAPAHDRTEEDSAASAAPPANAPKAKRPAEEEAEEAAVDDSDAAPALRRGPQDGTAVAQADRLFAAGRWVEAANAYRELLRRDPRNPDATRWRKRLVAGRGGDQPLSSAAIARSRRQRRRMAVLRLRGMTVPRTARSFVSYTRRQPTSWLRSP